jgi:hypothetical protein
MLSYTGGDTGNRMDEDFAADFVRRERITDALLEFERRIAERVLPVSEAECWDLLLNRASSRGGGSAVPHGAPPLQYETHDGVALLRVVDPNAPNRACLVCDLFGRSHCCGGMAFLYYALRDAGVERPLGLLGVEIEPGLYLADWEMMLANSRLISQKLRDYFEAHLERVSADSGC